MVSLAPRQLTELLQGVIPSTELCPAISVERLQQDSRKVVAGDCFIAVTGLETDGRRFVADALSRGAVAVVQEASELEGQRHGDVSFTGGIPLVHVRGLLQKISQMASQFFGAPSQKLSIFGVTGTNGKTSCAQLLAQLYSLAGKASAMMGTMGYGSISASGQGELHDTGMTTPDAIRCQKIVAEMAAAKVDTLAMEVSSHSLEQGRIAALDVDVAVFTNISRDHLDYHGTMANYAKAKAKLLCLSSLQAAVLNIDDDYGQLFYQQLKTAGKTAFSYSLSNSDADYYVSNIQYRSNGLSFTLHSPMGSAPVESALLGGFNLYNLVAVAAAAGAQGMDWGVMTTLLPKLAPVKGRMQLLRRAGITAVIDYAHTPDALDNALQAVRQHCQGRLCCVFGCGGDRDRGKRPQMGSVARAGADISIVTSDNPRSEDPQTIVNDILPAFSKGDKYLVEVDRKAAIEMAIGEAQEGDCVLIAGKGHENYQEIHGERLPFDDFELATAALDRRQQNFGEAG